MDEASYELLRLSGPLACKLTVSQIATWRNADRRLRDLLSETHLKVGDVVQARCVVETAIDNVVSLETVIRSVTLQAIGWAPLVATSSPECYDRLAGLVDRLNQLRDLFGRS